MALTDESVHAKSLDYWIAKYRELNDRYVRLSDSYDRALGRTVDLLNERNDARHELAQFEKVVVSTHPVVQHTLHVRRQDGTSEWVESGLGVYIRDDIEGGA